MKLSFSRRDVLGLTTAASASALLPRLAIAQQTFPNRAITYVVPFAAGGASDVVARVWAESASRTLGVPVIVDNKPGANGTIAMSSVSHAPADGYTLVMTTGSVSLNELTYKKLPYRNRDFVGVGLLGTASQVLVASPSSGFKTVDDLVRAAKQKPGDVAYGSGGVGNSTHINAEILARHFGVKFLHSPYKGSAPAMIGVMSGEVQFMLDIATTTIAQARAGKVVPLAVFGPERLPEIPDVPTVYELGLKNTLNGGWYAISAPASTPKEVITRLNRSLADMWADPAARKLLAGAYFTKLPDVSPGSVESYISRDAKLWGPLITDLGIRND